MKSKKARLKSNLDKVFSLYIRTKANFTCEWCGKSGSQVHCHHGVVHRRYIRTRFEEGNCACVCVGCHEFLGAFPNINTDFFKKRIGVDRIEQLERTARLTDKSSEPDLQEKLEYFKKKLEELE